MKRYLIILLAVCLLICGWSTVAVADTITRESFKEFQGKQFVNMERSIVLIQVIGHGIGRWEWNKEWREGYGTFIQSGMGFVMKGNFIVTAAHVIQPEAVHVPVEENFNVIAKVIEIVDRIISVGDRLIDSIPAEIQYMDTNADLAVLKYPGSFFIPLDYPILDAQHLIWTDEAVAMITQEQTANNGRSSWYEVRIGKIVSSQPKASEADLPWFNVFDFTTDIPAYPGDSGSPVFISLGGKLYIVGIVRAYSVLKKVSYMTRFTYIYPIIGGRG